MIKVSRNTLTGWVLVSGLLLGGCSLVAQPADVATESPVQTVTGKISGVGAAYTLNSNGKIIEITSRKIDFSQYNGKEVTVVGEYSGTTLYVDEIK